MPDDWRYSTWGEEVSLEYGKALRGYSKERGAYRVFGSNGQIGWTSEPLARGPGVILGRKGAYRGVEYSPEPFWVIDTAYYVVPKTKLDLRWVYYAIKYYKLGEIDDGSPIPSTTRAAVYIKEMQIPPFKDQEAIACILGALDDKIELNRTMNRTLEATAQATFKSWFVDFDPVRAKAAGQKSHGLKPEIVALFPDAFDDSSLGEIPKGWRIGVADDMAAFVLGGDWGKDAASSEFSQAAFCIRGADIPSLQSGGVGNMPIRYLKQSSIEKRSLRPYDIVVEISGGSPTQSTGRPVFVSGPLLEQLQHPLVCSNFCRLYRPKPDLSHFVYLWLRWLYSGEQFLQYENGTTGIKNFAFTAFCQRHEAIVPTADVLCAFNKIVDPLLQSIGQRGAESVALASTRDALLPALLSGQLAISDAERIAGRAL